MRLAYALIVPFGLLLLSGCQAARLGPTPARHDFGPVLVGAIKRIQPGGDWQNSGERAARITGLALGGSEAASFSLEPAFMRARVRPNERSPAIQALTFAPGRLGAHLATLAPVTADGADQSTAMALRGEGAYIVHHNDLTVVDGAGTSVTPPDPDKPVDCGRIPYATSATCTFTVRNDSPNPLTVVMGLIPGSTSGAFRVTAPPPPPATTLIGPSATQTVTVTFTPPNMTPTEWMFMAGVVVFNQTVLAGRTVCGVGFRPPEVPPAPPPTPAPAQLDCR